MRNSSPRRSSGSALVVAIVFLLLLSTLALAGLRSSATNVQIVGNMQARQEAQAAAQMLIEQLVSSAEFATNPVGVFNQTDQPNKPNAVTTDFNGDGAPDASAVLVAAPVCLRARAVAIIDLDPTNPAQAPCFGSASASNPNVSGGVPGQSLCADTEWQVTARGSDVRSGSSVTLIQGATVRRELVGADTICNN